MKNNSLTLYLEIRNLSYVFFVGENDEYENCKIVYKLELPLKGIDNGRITNFEEVSDLIKKNIFIIEQKLNHAFKEIVLILDNSELSFINLSGYKQLNGSQILKENITYILNTLKSCVHETESKKTILHIFNSKFYLDSKKIENLPIGLFGDFYAHELSFTLMNSNEHKIFCNLFEKMNLKIKKILIKSFINGVNISKNYQNIDNFFHIIINKNNSKIAYFENDSLKFEQSYKFGIDVVIKDISKITSLNIDTVKMILDKIELTDDIPEEELIEHNFFNNNNYRKIKKKLIYNIALARIKEISEIIFYKNINFQKYNIAFNNIFLEIDHNLKFKCLNEMFKTVFSLDGSNKIVFINFSNENMLDTAYKLVHFGWKKEAIPIFKIKKSFIAEVFGRLFG